MIEFDLSVAQVEALGIQEGDMLTTARANWLVQELRQDGTFNDCVWVVLRRVNE